MLLTDSIRLELNLLSFNSCSNVLQVTRYFSCVSSMQWRGSLTMVSTGSKAERTLFSQPVHKIVHYHHYHHQKLSLISVLPKVWLLRKMASLGFSYRSIMWSQSYLSKGSFQVNIKNKYSSTAKTECGVRQGSILGPLLFLLYVNNMKQAINCDLHLYADGSCLVYQHHDVSIIG